MWARSRRGARREVPLELGARRWSWFLGARADAEPLVGTGAGPPESDPQQHPGQKRRVRSRIRSSGAFRADACTAPPVASLCRVRAPSGPPGPERGGGPRATSACRARKSSFAFSGREVGVEPTEAAPPQAKAPHTMPVEGGSPGANPGRNSERHTPSGRATNFTDFGPGSSSGVARVWRVVGKVLGDKICETWPTSPGRGKRYCETSVRHLCRHRPRHPQNQPSSPNRRARLPDVGRNRPTKRKFALALLQFGPMLVGAQLSEGPGRGLSGPEV